jgi:hypothetical protein
VESYYSILDDEDIEGYATSISAVGVLTDTASLDIMKIEEAIATVCLVNTSHTPMYFDGACSGGSIVINDDLLRNPIKCGITVNSIVHADNLVGKCGTLPLIGRGYYVPGGHKSLISLIEMEKEGWEYTVKDQVMSLTHPLHKLNTHRDSNNGLYYVTYEELLLAEKISQASQLESNSTDVGGRVYNAETRVRAREALELHTKMGHPGDHSLISMLDNGNIDNCHLTSQDLRNARVLYGKCIACLQAKMRAPPVPTSLTPVKTLPGEKIHMDYKEFSVPTIGGNLGCNMAIDEASGYGFCLMTKSKRTEDQIESVSHMIQFMSEYGHTVKEIQCDNEIQYRACKSHWQSIGITLTQTISGQHEKLSERFIQSVIARARAALMDLNYDPPAKLTGELRVAAVFKWNLCINKASAPRTPMEIILGKKSKIPPCGWGTPGLFFDTQKIGGDTHERSEFGIVVGFNNDQRANLRVYMPHTGRLRNRGKFEVIPNIPSEWGWPQRIKVKNPILPAMEDIRQAIPSIPEGITGELNPLAPIIPEVHIVPKQQQTDTGPVYTLQRELEPVRLTEVRPIDIDDEAIVNNSVGEELPTAENKTDTYLNPTYWTGTSPVNDVHTEPIITRAGRVVKRPDYFSPNITEVYQQLYLNVMSVSVGSPTVLSDDRSTTAFKKEFDALFTQGVLLPLRVEDVTPLIMKRALPIQIVEVDKYDAEGIFEKRKARACIGGHRENPSDYGDTRSPTVNPMVIMIMVNLMAVLSLSGGVYDIVRAFLNTPVEDSKYIYSYLPKALSVRVVDIYPHLCTLVAPNGRLYFRVLKYLYGLHESSEKFGKWLGALFGRIGYQKSDYAESTYIKTYTDETKSIVGVHVDDMFAIFPDEVRKEEFEALLGGECEFTGQKGDYSFLGMSIKRDLVAKTATITQQGYTMDLLKKFNMGGSKPVDTPMSTMQKEDHLVGKEGDFEGKINPSQLCNKTDYLSLVMSLMYLARFTRPDILYAVSFLATSCSAPTFGDMTKAKRVLRYLKGTGGMGLKFSDDDGKPITMHCWVDASHGTHSDGKGHGGIVITLGSAPIFCKSYKLRHVTLSSTESEISALSEAVTYVVWGRMVLAEFGYTQSKPTIIHQDNKSAILMNNRGGGSFRKSKHLLVRRLFVNEFIEEQLLCLQYCPTEDMSADILTKTTSKDILRHLRDKLRLI